MRTSPKIRSIVLFVLLVAATAIVSVILRNKPTSGLIQSTLYEKQSVPVKVISFGYNHIGDYDKILFNHNGKLAWLCFPPHTAKYVMGVAAENKQAKVRFRQTGKAGPDAKDLFDLISIESEGQTVLPAQIAPPPPLVGSTITLSGKISAYQRDPKGEITSFALENHIVEIPKHLQPGLKALIANPCGITIKGFQRITDGFVNKSGLPLLVPVEIVIDKTTYLL